jgi:molybdopterin-containing oxidoreductase family membrane subunit
MITCNVIFPQVFWFKQARTHIPTIFVVSTFVNIGMWFERYVIIIGSLSREYDPAVWNVYTPQWAELIIFAGSFAFFAQFILLFIKGAPFIAISEVKELAIHARTHAKGAH